MLRRNSDTMSGTQLASAIRSKTYKTGRPVSGGMAPDNDPDDSGGMSDGDADNSRPYAVGMPRRSKGMRQIK